MTLQFPPAPRKYREDIALHYTHRSRDLGLIKDQNLGKISNKYNIFQRLICIRYRIICQGTLKFKQNTFMLMLISFKNLQTLLFAHMYLLNVLDDLFQFLEEREMPPIRTLRAAYFVTSYV
jgi:hypothetical protein